VGQKTDRRSTTDRPGYLLGSDADELSRLAFQHRVWAGAAASLWERAGFGRGHRIADLGCGPGFAALDLAHLVGPAGRVVAVDSSERFLAHLEAEARRQGLTNIEIQHGDVHDLAVAPESLDGAYARWLLCFARDPEEVVSRVARGLRRGGAFAVTDYFNYRAFTFARRASALDRIVEAVQASWQRQGGDLDVQGRVPGIMQRCGLEVTHVGAVSRIARPGSPLWDWPRTFFHNFLPTLQEMGLISPADREAFEREWAERSLDPGSFLFVPSMVDVIGVKR
jgi:SAM-dependent methyltransferase